MAFPTQFYINSKFCELNVGGRGAESHLYSTVVRLLTLIFRDVVFCLKCYCDRGTEDNKDHPYIAGTKGELLAMPVERNVSQS